MRIGVLADIHGNAQALDAAIVDCNNNGIDTFILLGDLYTKGPEPYKVFQRLSTCNVIERIAGNTEKWFNNNSIDNRKKAFVEYCNRSFPSVYQDIERMKDEFILDALDKKILFIHHWSKSMFSKRKLDEMNEKSIQIIISAHTHIPIDILSDNQNDDSIIHWNPGSVGTPYDGDWRCSFGILTIENEISFEIVRVDYDIEKERKIAISQNIPYLREYLKVIERGKA